MSKTTNINVRLDPELKEQAELVLGHLGIPLSNAVNIFLKQVVIQRGIPFDVKLPSENPIALSKLNKLEINEELEKGYTETQGKTKSAKQVISDIHKDYDL
jgi:DNA-damage-inducible protein J